MIRVVNVTQHYGVKPVLKQISMEIPDFSRTAVIGPNGMGKTTFLSVLGGVLQPQKGYVEINGLRRRSSVENERSIRKQAVFLPDRCFLPKNRTGREYLLGVGRMYELDNERIVDHASRLLKLFDLNALADSPIRTYSSGQQKKISLCSALITEAKTLLLDEPFSGGLDPSGILALKHVLRRMCTEWGRTVVLTSPVPEMVVEVADRLVVIKEGRVTIDGAIEDLKRQTGHTGNLDKLLNEAIFPETFDNVQSYFEDDGFFAGERE